MKWRQSNQNKREIRNWNWIRIRIEQIELTKWNVCYDSYKFTHIVYSQYSNPSAHRFIVPTTIILIDIHTERKPDGLRICTAAKSFSLIERIDCHLLSSGSSSSIENLLFGFSCVFVFVSVCEWKKSQKYELRLIRFGTKLFGVLQTKNEHGAFVHWNSFIFEIPKNYNFCVYIY